MRLLSFDIEDRMKSIGWYQIAGGVIGFYMVIVGLINEGTLTGVNFVLYSLAIILVSFSIYCGNLLRKKDMKGLNLSLWNQALQVIQIGVWAIGYAYYSGIRITFGFDWGETFNPDGTFGLSGFWFRYTPEETSHLMIWINVVPILIIYWINKIENDIEERKQLMETAKKVSEEHNSDGVVSSLPQH